MCKIKNIFPVLLALFFIFSHPANANVSQDLISKVSFGRAADVEILLQQKADPNIANAAGISALFLAVLRSDDEAPKIVEALIRGGADIHRTASSGNLPIVEAVKRGHPLTVKALVQHGSLMSVTDTNGTDLPTLAQIRANNEIAGYVAAGYAAEQKKLAELKSPDNLQKLVRQYSRLACTEYYLTYYQRENPDKISEEKFNDLMGNAKADSDFTKDQLSSLFDLSASALSTISTQSKQQTENKLGSLLTKENRLYNGLGTNTHLNSVCKTISEKWDGKRLLAKPKH
jgi:hypothetical protein